MQYTKEPDYIILDAITRKMCLRDSLLRTKQQDEEFYLKSFQPLENVVFIKVLQFFFQRFYLKMNSWSHFLLSFQIFTDFIVQNDITFLSSISESTRNSKRFGFLYSLLHTIIVCFLFFCVYSYRAVFKQRSTFIIRLWNYIIVIIS